MWQNQIGGGAVTRWTGAKDAITSILTDGTLTAGANFGFGHWNAGEEIKVERTPRGGACHRNNSRCTYYSGWTGTHNRGRSNQCTTNSCINVGISSEGAARTIPILQALGVEWGTDANAFSEMALITTFQGITKPMIQPQIVN